LAQWHYPQRIDLIDARSQLSNQLDYLIGHWLDIDTSDLAKTRSDYMGKMTELMQKMDVIIRGPVSDKPVDVASWRKLFSELHEFYGKEYSAFSNAYIEDQMARISELSAGVRKSEDGVLGLQ
jgi:hypothetical protein